MYIEPIDIPENIDTTTPTPDILSPAEDLDLQEIQESLKNLTLTIYDEYPPNYSSLE